MKKHLILALIGILPIAAMSQGVKIGNTPGNPDASAILELESQSGGLLPPRMTTAERNLISNPALGLQIFNTTTNCINIYVGSTWKQVCGDCDFNSPVAGNNGPICEGSGLNLSATSIIGATYQWSGPNGFTSNLQNPVIPNATISAGGAYSVTATVNGCTSQVQSTVAAVNPTPDNPVAGNSGPVCQGSTIGLTASELMGVTYSWTGPNAFTSNSQNPEISNNAQVGMSGTYTVTATVNGCSSDPVQTNVVVNPLPSSSFSPLTASQGIAKTFTPATAGAAYNWTFQSGSPSSSSAESPAVTWSGNGSYTVTLQVTAAGCSSNTSAQVVVSTPVVQTFNYTGSIVNWTVPAGVTAAIIEASGAGGGSGTLGARMRGTFTVTPGSALKVLVGGAPSGMAGGGGSFVTLSNNTPLIVAGAGGHKFEGSCSATEMNGRTTTSGGTCGSTPRADNGNGGNVGFSTSGGGGGLLTNGQGTAGGTAFVNGGTIVSDGSNIGGFGGGGARTGSFGEGAGGGYSGGSCGNISGGWFGCGGGGSFNGGSNQSNSAGVQSGNGIVTITY
jgi:hypothetical protein